MNIKHKMPALTDEQRETIVCEAEHIIENEYNNFNATDIAKAQILLSALTASKVYFAEDLQEPGKLVRIDSARYESIVEGCRNKQVYYTAPPVPALKPIELPNASNPEISKGGWAWLVPNSNGKWLNKEEVQEAIRKAGHEVKE